MSEIAIAVRDPDGKRHAQLVHDDLPVHEVTILFVHRLDLPGKLNYEVRSQGAKKALDADKSLNAQKIEAGSELEIRPLRDDLFDILVEELKAEILSDVKGEVKERAKRTLTALLGSREAAQELASAGGQASGPAAKMDAAPEPADAQPTPAETAPSEAAPGRAGSRGSCLRWGCATVVVAGLAAAALLYFFYDDYLAPTVEAMIGQLTGVSQREEPVLGTGDVQVTLRWTNPVDLDLHVYDPDGEQIWFSNTSSASGGALDVDANGQCGDDAPVENVFWPTDGAPLGSYAVYVVYYQDCGYVGASAYSVALLVDGVSYGPFEGVFSGATGEEHFVTSFDR